MDAINESVQADESFQSKATGDESCDEVTEAVDDQDVTEETAPEYLISKKKWREGKLPELGRKKRYPFRISPSDLQARPFVFLKLTSYVDPSRSVVFPGIIDSGAHSSLAPRSLCDKLGIAWDSGSPCASTTGIDGLAVGAYTHSFNMGVYAEPEVDSRSVADFGPFVCGLQVLASEMPYILLGQSDFLSRFHYAQTIAQGWFELQWNI